MRSDKQIEASRQNGAQSHGPVTPEGKQRVADNAIKHGLCSRRMLLPDESEEELHILEIHWLRQLYPQSPAERELVMDVVACAWRIKRFQRAEASLLAAEMAKHGDDPEALGHALHDLADNSRALHLLNRYAARARREFEHALETYRQTAKIRQEQQLHDGSTLTDVQYFHKWGICISADPRSNSMYYRRECDFLPNKPTPANILVPDPIKPPPQPDSPPTM